MASTPKSKGKPSNRAASATKARSASRTAGRTAVASKKPAAKHKPIPISIKPSPKGKSKTGRQPLTIKPPPRKPLPDSAVALKEAAKKAAAANGALKTPKGGKKPMTDAEKNSLLKSKKTRTVAEAASEIKADAKGYVFINGRRVRMISTKGHAPIKKSRPVAATQTAAEADAAAKAIRAIKTKLQRKELNEYRDLLLAKRRQLVGDLTSMEDQALRPGGGNLSSMPIHMADIGTDTFDQDFTLKLAETERQQLREIDAALQRIADGTYGVCQLTGKPIPKARLEAKPWAKYTVESARIIESQWGR